MMADNRLGLKSLIALVSKGSAMQQLTKSLGSFSWAMSLFGFQQMMNALSATSGDSRAKAIGALDEITNVSLEHCGRAARDTFDAGDKLQRGMIDLMFRFMPLAGSERAVRDCSCGQSADSRHRANDREYAASDTTAPTMTRPTNWDPSHRWRSMQQDVS
jgi:hypothetical protein